MVPDSCWLRSRCVVVVQTWRQSFPEAIIISVPQAIDVIAEYIIRCQARHSGYVAEC